MITSEAILPDRPEDGRPPSNVRTVGRIVRADVRGNEAILYGENAKAALRFMGGGIVRIKLLFGETVDWTPTAAISADPGALAAERPIAVRREETDALITLSTEGLRVVASRERFGLRVFDGEGRPLLDAVRFEWDGKGRVSCAAAKSEKSHFYGFGEKTGYLDKNGERYEMWNSDVFAAHVQDTDALYQSIPFLIHYEYERPAYGLLLDNPGRTALDMRTFDDRYTVNVESGELDLYVMAGPSIKDVVSRMTTLTGRQYLPPKWAIGYQQSRYSYMNQEEVLQVARLFREKKIPCDVLYLDIHYMDEYRVFTWDKSRFPKPDEMMAELAAMGFRVVPIVDPGVKKDPSYPVYAEGVRNGYFCRKLEGDLFIGPVWPGPSAFPDFTDDAAAQWWGDRHRFYIDHGIRGIWNDMNEPSVFNDSKTMDLDVVHGNNGRPKTHGEWHNLYGFLMSKATYEGMKRGMAGERPFVLTRAGYAGIQRYAAVWTGDNRSFWDHLAMSIPMVLNLGLSGVAFAGPDIGGFTHHASGELLARWTQAGALFPFCRNHSVIDSRRQEPWAFGERIEAICREYIGLRYRLLPYFYSLFYEAHTTGLPIVRSLIMEYPEDREVYDLCDQFLLGTSLLAAPIYRPGTVSRSAYLPEGVWYDYWTAETFEGGRHVLAHAPLEKLPLYVRAGAIYAEQALRQHADEAGDGAIALNVFAGGSGEYRHFEDDGGTFAYEEGQYSLSVWRWEERDGEAALSRESLHDGWGGACRVAEVVVRHARKPARVEHDGSVEEWTYDESARTLRLRLSETLSEPIVVRY